MILRQRFFNMQFLKLLSIFILTSILTISCENSINSENADKSSGHLKPSPSIKKTLFSSIPSSQSGIDFANNLKETLELNIINYHYFYNGGGVACGDLNNDGLPDLFFTANQGPNKLYLNKGGLVFEDFTHLLPKQNPNQWTTGVTMADVNHDGWLDIYVSQSGNLSSEDRKNLLYINLAGEGFVEKAAEYGLDDPAYSTQAAFFDFDKDGDLDMYLLNHEIRSISNYNRETRLSGRDPYIGDKLYRNEGDTFVEIGQRAGIYASPYGFGLGVAIGDFNNDAWADIYVTNDFLENDFLYINKKNGVFKESIQEMTKHISNYGMGTDVADFNNDGWADIIVVDMVARDHFRQKTNMSGMDPEKFWKSIQFGFHYQYMYNTLQMNQGGEKFSEVGQRTGISSTDWSWAPLMADFDLDGKKDIYITNGLRKDVRNNDFVNKHILFAEQMPKNKGLSAEQILQNQLREMPSQAISNYIFKNKGEIQFEDQTKKWGLQKPSFSNGAVYADLDLDGDLDIVTNNIDQEAFLFENTASDQSDKNFLHVILEGSKKNPNGIGSKVKLITDEGLQIWEIYTTRGYQSSVPPMAYFGLSKGDNIKAVEVTWPDQSISKIDDPKVNQTLTVNYRESTNPKITQKKSNEAVFIPVTKKHHINYLHTENEYDDFKDQILLPHKLSNLGPALEVGDLNGDGMEDFLVGGAHMSPTVIYLQKKDGTFERTDAGFPKGHENFEDIDAVFFDADNDGDLDIYLASGGYEFDQSTQHLYDRIYLNDGNANFTFAPERLPDFKVNTGCVRAFDYDDDGDLDLFVGGRLISKQYPFSPNSYLLKNDGDKFVDVTDEVIPELRKIGMVTSAEWMDINGDKAAELIVAGEWMPIRVFQSEKGKFNLLDETSLGLEKTDGWWFSLQQIDYDQDGDMDLIGGNLGLNYKYKASKNRPFKVFGQDFDQNQTVDIVLSYAEEGAYYPVRGRECSSDQMPFIKEKFPDYKSFAQANVYDILGEDQISNSLELNAYTFATTLFENRDGKFYPHKMNDYLQLSSINDIEVFDLNLDGYQDLIMAGNLYGAEVETPRNDAGFGNILLGKGSSDFEILNPSKTNYFGEGEVRKIKAIQIQDQYTAFLVAKNSGDLELYRFLSKKELP